MEIWRRSTKKYAFKYNRFCKYLLNNDSKFYLSVGVGSGGIADFPDDSTTGKIDRRTNKPWRNDDPKAELNFWNDRINWESTWTTDNIRMEIDYIRVYAI